MQFPRLKIDVVSVTRATNSAKTWCDHQIKLTEKLQTDVDKTKRIGEQKCKCCYYLSRVSGSAMSKRPCAVCAKTLHSGCTDVNVLCKECAVEHGLCVHCAGDIDMKNRRKERTFNIAGENYDDTTI